MTKLEIFRDDRGNFLTIKDHFHYRVYDNLEKGKIIRLVTIGNRVICFEYKVININSISLNIEIDVDVELVKDYHVPNEHYILYEIEDSCHKQIAWFSKFDEASTEYNKLESAKIIKTHINATWSEIIMKKVVNNE